MISLMLLALLSGFQLPESPPVESQARLINRNELPNDLNLPFHENGFAVVSVRLVNKGTEALKIDTAKIRVLDPKNKPLVAATSSEVTPKMVKSGARLPPISAGSGSPPIFIPGYGGRPIETGATIGGGGAGTIDVGRVERLKAAIEKYQLKSTDVLTGEKAEGFLYLKTDKDPDQLKGTRIVITDGVTLTVE